MPLGYYLLVRLARILPGDPHVILRLPSILGYLLALLAVYWFARRAFPAIAALSAVVFITLSPFREFAVEARAYSLLVGFLAISAVFWQRIDLQRLMTPLFAISLAAAVACHHLAVVAISAFGIAELIWAIQARRIRWGVWAACVFATSPFLLNLPILLHYRDIFGKDFWSLPSWTMTVWSYGDYLGLDYKLALVLVLFFGLIVACLLLRMIRQPIEAARVDGFSLPEIVLVAGFLFYPALLVVLTKLVGSGYTSRYGWPAILGLVLGSVYLARTIWPKSYSAWLLVALMITFASQGGTELFKARSSGADGRWSRLSELSRAEPTLPVAIGSGIAYFEAAEYAPPELRDRLTTVADPTTARRLIGSGSVDTELRLLTRFVPLRVEDLDAFRAAHQKFILYSGGHFDWFTQYLIENRYRLTLLSTDAGGSTFIVER